jgi:hypothetical protein
MRPLWLALPGVVVAAVVAGPAPAQNAPIQSQSLPPLQQQWQQGGAPPLQQQAPGQAGAGAGDAGPPALGQTAPGPQPGAGAPAGPVQAGPVQAGPAPQTAPGWPNIWIPATAAKLQALDKVNAQTADLTIKVGQSATFGSLTITVKACMVRPSDQAADATAFLDVTDSHPDSPGFDGWILRDEPSVSMLQNPIYDLHVTGCG